MRLRRLLRRGGNGAGTIEAGTIEAAMDKGDKRSTKVFNTQGKKDKGPVSFYVIPLPRYLLGTMHLAYLI